MADKIFHSTAVTFVDMTDSRILDVYISSNHPTVQICNVNQAPLEYTPDWSTNNLELEASFYLDSSEITPDTIEWYTKIGTTETTVGNESALYVTNNVLEDNAIITYGCRATYQNLESFKEITFTRVDTGLNGTNGTSAPAVQAQYSADGSTGWSSTLNTATHKYIRYSYDGGKTWTASIKIVGEDGTSVNIKGTATSREEVEGTSYYTLVYNSTTITGAAIGDAYLLNGDLYVCVDSKDGDDHFMDVGRIQGPQGSDGQSSYVFIRYATDANGSNMTVSPSNTTTHIGICTVNTNIAPTTAGSYTWSKFVGDNAKSIALSGTSQIFKVSQDSTPVYTPTTIMVTAQVVNTTIATWEYSVNGGINWSTTAPTGVSLNTSTNTLTITGKDLQSNALVIKASNGTYKDVYTVYKVFDGINGNDGDKGDAASIAFLTNENMSFAASASGVVNNALTLQVTTSVVAYKGTTKQMPVLGSISQTDIPSGMKIAVTDDTTLQEKRLTISFDSGATLGSIASNSGTITIPVTSPVSTNLKLSWSKINTGATGVGIASTTVSYGESDSSSAQPTSWQTTIPDVAEGNYLWTRTIIDYTDTNQADTVTYTYSKQGTKGDEGKGGTSVTVSSIQYQEGSSATTAPTGTWQDAVVAAAEGKYLWTKTVFSDGKTAYGVAKQGAIGTPASLVDITPSAYYFKSTAGKDGTFTPDYIYLYPRFQTVTFSKWEYSVNGGATWVAASGANGISISEYNSVKNTLRIARTSTLYTDTITSISFRCVSSTASVYDTVSIAKIYDVVDLQIGGRNYILNSANLTVSGLGSSNGSRMEYKYIDVGQSYMDITSGTEVTISFDLEMTVNTANPTLLIYNTNRKGPKTIVNKTLQFTAAVGTTIKQRCYVVTTLTDRTDATLTTNSIEFYSTYETYNWFKISNLKLEIGNKATDWSPAPEDLKSTTFQLYAPKGYLITNDVPSITLETFAYDGSQPITNATFAWSSWNGESWMAIGGAAGTSLVLDRSNIFKSGIYKCDMTYGDKVYTATATIEDKTDVYDSLIHVTSKYSPTNRLYWVLYSSVYSEEGEKDTLLGPISVTAPSNPANGAYWYKIDETNYTVTLMKYSGSAWVTTTDKQVFVYDWFMLNDTNNIVTLGERSKVKIVTSDNFSRTCSVQCNVLDQELSALTHSNQVLNDPSDPIVSETEPTNPINGQLWIKTGTSGSYTLLIWDASNSKWVISEADSQKKVYVSKPNTYNDGDIWIVAAEYEPDSYINGVLQTEVVDGVTKAVKHLAGTMLRAQYGSNTYKDSDWVDALIYKKELDKLKENLDVYNQFFTFDNTGMTMKAKSLNGQISEFSTKLTNNELGFYQGENKVAYINNNQLNISKAEITNGMTIGGNAPILQIGNFTIIQESNGSLSIGLKS